MKLGVSRSRWLWLPSVSLLFLAISAMDSLAAKEAERTGFAGTWSLDAARSEDPQKKLEAAMEEMRASRMGGMGRGGGAGFPGGGGGGGGGGMGGGGGRGGMGGGPGGGDRQARMEQVMKNLEAPKTVAMDILSGEVRIQEDSKPIRLISTDGRKRETEIHGVSAEHKAEWKKGVLRYELKTHAERSMKRTETYEISPDGKVLTVMVDLEPPGQMPDISIRRVYVRRESAPSDEVEPKSGGSQSQE